VISSIEITRFRGIREGRLDDLTPLVVLVGPNGCGKSTVLDAILLGASPEVPDATIKVVTERHTGVPDGTRWFFWRANTRDGSSLVVKSRSGNVLARELQFPFRLRWRRSQSQRDDFDMPTREENQALDEIQEVRLIEPRMFERQTPLHRLYSQAREQGRKAQAEALVAEVVPNVSELEILTEGDTPILHLVFEDRSVPVAFAGDGVYSLVQLCLELAARPRGVVLLEEPEVHQHPAAIRQSVRAILAAVRRDVQVILTTHSLELVDYILAESSSEELQNLSVYRLQLKDGALTSHRTPGVDVSFLRTQIESDLR
jgi:predicted ATPase